jgi:hypothetical protein
VQQNRAVGAASRQRTAKSLCFMGSREARRWKDLRAGEWREEGEPSRTTAVGTRQRSLPVKNTGSKLYQTGSTLLA